MTIDSSGEFWRGTEGGDIEAYLRALTADGHRVDEVRRSLCGCGGARHRLEADAEEGCVRRACADCGAARFIADGEEVAEDAELAPVDCPDCGGEVFDVSVGHSLRKAAPGAPAETHWVSVGLRCVGCGLLGCIADWGVDDDPARPLIERA